MVGPVQSDLISVNGAEIYYERRGQGPAIVLVPGGSVDGRFYDPLAELLSDEFTVVTYDRRGNSRSPKPPGWSTTSMAEQADDIAGLIETLGVTPSFVWTSSVGGVFGLYLLGHYPQLLRGLILHEPPLFSVLDDGPALLAEVAERVQPAMERGGPRAALELHSRAELGDLFDRLDPHLRAAMLDNAEVFFTVELPGIGASMPAPEVAAKVLRSTKVPTRVVVGENTGGAPLYRTSDWIAQQLGSTLYEVPGGHLPHLTEPEKTAALIRSFAQEVAS